MTGLKRPYNSRIIQIYLKLLSQKYPEINQNELLAYAGMKRYEAEDEGFWFTQKQVDRFQERIVALTGNPDIAREAGQFSCHLQTNSIFRRYFLGILGPVQAYMMLEKKASFITKSTSFKTRKISNQKVVVTVTPMDGITEKEYQCRNRMGTLESVAIPILHSTPRIDHPKCVMRGDDACVYEISWRNNLPMLIKRFRYYYFIFVCLIAAGLFPLMDLTHWVIAGLSLFLSSALLTIGSKTQEVKQMRETMKELHLSSDQLLEQTKNHTIQANLANEVGQAISVHGDIGLLIDDINSIFEEHINFDRGIILLVDEQREHLEFKAGFGIQEKHRKLLLENTFSINNPDSTGIFSACINKRKAFLVNNLDEIENDLSPRSKAFGRMIGTKSFICCPITNENEAIGLLAVDNITTDRHLLNSDLNFLKGIATVIGMGIENIKLYQGTETQFKSIIQVLATSIDARDFLTAGHSEKVTTYALGICQELELDDDFKEMIRIAALLHDYGKIAVPDSILKKKGTLSPEEYAIIQTHAIKTKEILDKIQFQGIYTQVPEIAYSHHERIDGKGYPRGLKGDEIPFGAKIIAVADFFDAITSKRHYRSPMDMATAVATIRAEVGGHLDPDLTEALLSYLGKQGILQGKLYRTAKIRKRQTFPQAMISGV
ncbi:MAG: HD domain-containing protein [Spirochaetales bacterium]|nr:HD domain-containing protein [Spirochaetales bacterium]